MNVYLRKVDNQCINKQISITKEVHEFFFGNPQDHAVVNMVGKNSNKSKNVSFLLNTDPRLGGGIKQIIKEEGDMKVDDLLMFARINQGFSLEVIRQSDSRYNAYFSIMQNERHLIVFLDNGNGAVKETSNSDSTAIESADGVSVIEEINKLDEYIKNTCQAISRNPRTNKIHPLNFIVYGAPGTGKTYSMVEYALAIIENKSIDEFRNENTDRITNVKRYKQLISDEQVVFTTFHQNYGYEEFIQGLRPDINSEAIAFKIVDGIFKTIADRALNDTENKNYIIIIDEINRANISKVFGELITLIDKDKRWGEIDEMCATLQSGDIFTVPNNLYIVGTMNSADKSISLIDSALRRRFDFIEQKPNSDLVTDGVLKKMLEAINLKLVEEFDSTDLLVGHSYFMNKNESDLCNILNNNIIPLLYEYFYDNRKKIANLINESIRKSNAKILIDDDKIGRLRVKEE